MSNPTSTSIYKGWIKAHKAKSLLYLVFLFLLIYLIYKYEFSNPLVRANLKTPMAANQIFNLSDNDTICILNYYQDRLDEKSNITTTINNYLNKNNYKKTTSDESWEIIIIKNSANFHSVKIYDSFGMRLENSVDNKNYHECASAAKTFITRPSYRSIFFTWE